MAKAWSYGGKRQLLRTRVALRLLAAVTGTHIEHTGPLRSILIPLVATIRLMNDHPEPLAHSTGPTGIPQPLVEHLRNVAHRARALALGDDLGYWLGLWHDLGKFNPGFQRYIRELHAERGPDHSSAGGVLYNLVAPTLGWPAFTGAFCIMGHHGGLPNRVDLEQRLRDKRGDPTVRRSLELASHRISDLLPASAGPGFSTTARLEESALDVRMRFSALVDADWLDTESHFARDRSEIREQPYRSLAELWPLFESDHEQLMSRGSGELGRIRREIYERCLEAADLESGVFRLTVPTGGGKTRSSMGFALRHGLAHGKRRIIYAIPYTSIIEQTTDVFRSIFGADVLEHHSAVEYGLDDRSEDPALLRARLATENWDAPIVITTTVQLFESLFASRPSRCRKLHSIAESVIILDEVQTLPVRLLGPILDCLRQLVERYGVTVVLCSATQPALTDPDSPYLRGLPGAREIVTPSAYFEAMARVHYQIELDQTISWDAMAERVESERQALVVLNTKKDAVRLMGKLSGDATYHLSTLMCGAHRRDVLHRVREALAAGDECRVVSTQVIEAGVDLDFPVVYRALGPLDRIVQVAGRCNREARHETGRVVVFRPEGGDLPPGEYRTATDTASAMLRGDGSRLQGPDLYEAYFRRLYQALPTDRRNVRAMESRLAFQDTARAFRLIEDDTVPVVVPYGPQRVGQILQRIRRIGPSRQRMRALQPYLVNVRRREVDRLLQRGHVEPIGGLELYEWLGGYDSRLGIGATADPESWIIV